MTNSAIIYYMFRLQIMITYSSQIQSKRHNILYVLLIKYTLNGAQMSQNYTKSRSFKYNDFVQYLNIKTFYKETVNFN